MAVREYFLDEAGEYTLAAVMELEPRWLDLDLSGELSRAHIIVPGEVLATPELTAGSEPRVWLNLARGLPRISDDGLDAELWLCRGDRQRRLMAWHMDNSDAGKTTLELALPLAPGESFRLELRCGAGPRGIPDADWLAVLEWVVGSSDRLSLLRARCHGRWRMRNELAHFKAAYDSEFYRARRVDRGGESHAADVRSLPGNAGRIRPIDPDLLAQRLGDPPVQPGENAFQYTHRLLRMLLTQPSPDFAGRLRALQQRDPERPLRMLSLCAGEAAVEGALLAQADVPVRLCLLDVNETLLERAAERMPHQVQVDRVLGSVDALGQDLGEFDVVNITSGLHHLVEVEQVLAAIAAVLAPGGEFWLIGEQVGRNGNRLWPEAREAADAVFSAWPAEKRRNANTGKTDARIPDLDYGASSFEGIRSQELEALLARYFLPLQVHLLDAFLWRLVDAAYAGNFDLGCAQDRRLLQQAVVAEARHWLEGGRSTSLNGAWRSKRDLLFNRGTVSAV